ncbi:MAG TPA: hypothetical protein VKP60_09030 [Magnetospirillaceae bacterium]|nr:hypothetical protein [Magnetospirillaceae bacterium]
MRNACLFALLLTLAACSSQPPDLQAVAPLNSRPVIEQVTYRTADQDRGPVIYPELHFRSPDGNVVAIHRELVSNDSPKALLNFVSDSPVSIGPDQQKEGAVYAGGWQCGADKYRAQLRAYLIDTNHNHSNTVDYSIVCAQ